MSDHPTAIEKRELRNVLGAFTTGVTVITTRDPQGRPQGLTANSFSSVSLDPPLVLWSQAATSSCFPAFRDAEHFAVNILADHQIAVSNQFAQSGADKFSGIAADEGIGGVPVLRETAAHLECTKVAAYPGGDHVVYLGRVERVSLSGRRPLAFASGKYMVPYAHELGPTELVLSGILPFPMAALRHAQAALPRIAEAVGQHSLALGVWGNHGPTIVQWEPSAVPVSEHFPAALVVSCTRTTTGLAFSAFLPQPVVERFVTEDLRLWRQPGEQEAGQRAHFDAQLAEIRERGLARVVDREPSMLHKVRTNAFSAPIFDRHGAMVMSIAAVGSAERLDSAWSGSVPTALKQAAAELTAEIARI